MNETEHPESDNRTSRIQYPNVSNVYIEGLTKQKMMDTRSNSILFDIAKSRRKTVGYERFIQFVGVVVDDLLQGRGIGGENPRSTARHNQKPAGSLISQLIPNGGKDDEAVPLR